MLWQLIVLAIIGVVNCSRVQLVYFHGTPTPRLINSRWAWSNARVMFQKTWIKIYSSRAQVSVVYARNKAGVFRCFNYAVENQRISLEPVGNDQVVVCPNPKIKLDSICEAAILYGSKFYDKAKQLLGKERCAIFQSIPVQTTTEETRISLTLDLASDASIEEFISSLRDLIRDPNHDLIPILKDRVKINANHFSAWIVNVSDQDTVKQSWNAISSSQNIKVEDGDHIFLCLGADNNCLRQSMIKSYFETAKIFSPRTNPVIVARVTKKL